MVTGPIIAEIAALLGDPARATMVSALLDGRPLTASELAQTAGIRPQTASTHLAKLTAAGVLSVARRGRHRHFRLASAAVVEMIEGIVAVALARRPRYLPLSRQARALGAARICYDHLAGRLSVDLTDALVARRYVALDGEAARVTPSGIRFLGALGVRLRSPRPAGRACRLCLDWTERRPHLAGPVGLGRADAAGSRGGRHRAGAARLPADPRRGRVLARPPGAADASIAVEACPAGRHAIGGTIGPRETTALPARASRAARATRSR
jgi:DNA-binding transcriptional ArsR family regulator